MVSGTAHPAAERRPSAAVSHRALDGGLVTVRSGLDLGKPFTAYLEVKIGSRIQEFEAGSAGAAIDSARDAGVRSFPHEYRFQNGTLRFGSAFYSDNKTKVRSQITVAVWEGRRYSVGTHIYNARSHQELLSAVNRVRIVENPDGLTIIPKQPAVNPVLGASMLKEIPGLGVLQIQPAAGPLMRSMPKWHGRAVPGGELFADKGPAGKVEAFVLAGHGAATSLVLDDADTAEEVLSDLAELRVEWKQA